MASRARATRQHRPGSASGAQAAALQLLGRLQRSSVRQRCSSTGGRQRQPPPLLSSSSSPNSFSSAVWCQQDLQAYLALPFSGRSRRPC